MQQLIHRLQHLPEPMQISMMSYMQQKAQPGWQDMRAENPVWSPHIIHQLCQHQNQQDINLLSTHLWGSQQSRPYNSLHQEHVAGQRIQVHISKTDIKELSRIYFHQIVQDQHSSMFFATFFFPFPTSLLWPERSP